MDKVKPKPATKLELFEIQVRMLREMRQFRETLTSLERYLVEKLASIEARLSSAPARPVQVQSGEPALSQPVRQGAVPNVAPTPKPNNSSATSGPLGLVVGKPAPGTKPQGEVKRAEIPEVFRKASHGLDFKAEGIGEALNFSDNF